jgi:hypothetical protein
VEPVELDELDIAHSRLYRFVSSGNLGEFRTLFQCI